VRLPRIFAGNLGVEMLWTIVAILLILWLLGFTLHIGAGLIHILLVVALVVFIFNMLTGRRN
jgi:hypothetical protein